MYYIILQYSDYETENTDIVPMKRWNTKYEEFLLDIARDICGDYKIKAVIKGDIEFNDSMIHESIEDFYDYHKGKPNKIAQFAFERLKELDDNTDVLEEIQRYSNN